MKVAHDHLTTRWRVVLESARYVVSTFGERTVRCINQVVPRCHTCWRATLNLTTFKTSSMAPQGFHWPSLEPYCPFCPSLPPNSFDAGLFLLEIKPHDWWLGSMPVGKSLQITFEMSPNIWNGKPYIIHKVRLVTLKKRLSDCIENLIKKVLNLRILLLVGTF